jgi:hypothetical protein
MNMITDNYAQSITDFDKYVNHRRQRQDTIPLGNLPYLRNPRLRLNLRPTLPQTQKYKVQRTSFMLHTHTHATSHRHRTATATGFGE